MKRDPKHHRIIKNLRHLQILLEMVLNDIDW